MHEVSEKKVYIYPAIIAYIIQQKIEAWKKGCYKNCETKLLTTVIWSFQRPKKNNNISTGTS